VADTTDMGDITMEATTASRGVSVSAGSLASAPDTTAINRATARGASLVDPVGANMLIRTAVRKSTDTVARFIEFELLPDASSGFKYGYHVGRWVAWT